MFNCNLVTFGIIFNYDALFELIMREKGDVQTTKACEANICVKRNQLVMTTVT